MMVLVCNARVITPAEAIARKRFCEAFKRSRKGNLWRLFTPEGSLERITLAIFPDKGGRGYAYSIATREGLTYSEDAWDAVGEAVRGCSKRPISLNQGHGKEAIPHRSYERAVEARRTL